MRLPPRSSAGRGHVASPGGSPALMSPSTCPAGEGGGSRGCKALDRGMGRGGDESVARWAAAAVWGTTRGGEGSSPRTPCPQFLLSAAPAGTPPPLQGRLTFLVPKGRAERGAGVRPPSSSSLGSRAAAQERPAQRPVPGQRMVQERAATRSGPGARRPAGNLGIHVPEAPCAVPRLFLRVFSPRKRSPRAA